MDPWLQQFETRVTERASSDPADRTFTVLGATLTVKPSIAPQVGTSYRSARLRLTEHLIARREATDAGREPEDAPADLTDVALLNMFEATARACLEPASLAAWNELRDGERPNPLSWADLFGIDGLLDYIVGRASGIPTEGPTGSSAGPPSAPTKSKAASSSPGRARKR